MKNLLRLLLILCTVIALPSCVSMDPYGYNGGSYNDSYNDSPFYSTSPSYSRPYYGGNSYYGGGGYYGSGYSHRVSVCRVCGHNPCSCRASHASHSYVPPRNRDRDDRSDRDRDRDRNSGGGNRIKLTTGRDNLPQGYHSKDWFEKRGINVRSHSYVKENGEKHKKR